jgi:hypothetical protein
MKVIVTMDGTVHSYPREIAASGRYFNKRVRHRHSAKRSMQIIMKVAISR